MSKDLVWKIISFFSILTDQNRFFHTFAGRKIDQLFQTP